MAIEKQLDIRIESVKVHVEVIVSEKTKLLGKASFHLTTNVGVISLLGFGMFKRNEVKEGQNDYYIMPPSIGRGGNYTNITLIPKEIKDQLELLAIEQYHISHAKVMEKIGNEKEANDPNASNSDIDMQ